MVLGFQTHGVPSPLLGDLLPCRHLLHPPVILELPQLGCATSAEGGAGSVLLTPHTRACSRKLLSKYLSNE